MTELLTPRLLLRPWRLDEADIDFAYDLYSRWDVQRFIGRVPRVAADRDEAATRVARYAGEPHTATHAISLVVRRDTGAPVGTLLLKPIPASGPVEPLQPSGDTEIGWHFHPDHWGQGFATEAAQAVLARALASGLDRVVAVTHPDNRASQAVCLRLGMTDEGLTEAYYNTSCRLFMARAPGQSAP